jgi:hypothetical protein
MYIGIGRRIDSRHFGIQIDHRTDELGSFRSSSTKLVIHGMNDAENSPHTTRTNLPTLWGYAFVPQFLEIPFRKISMIQRRIPQKGG